MDDRKQSKPLLDENGKFAKGNIPPAGFNANPQNRSNGRWRKEDSISYNYNLFLSMSEEEFAEYKPKTKAQRIAYNRVKDAEESLNDVKEITDRTEGKAQQTVDVTTGGEAIVTPVVRIIDERQK